MALLPIIGGALGAAGAVAGLFGGDEEYPEFEAPEIDLDAEMAKLGTIYKSQESALETESIAQQAQTRAALASDLAARGIFESPVSQQAFSRSSADAARALNLAKAQIKSQYANAATGLQQKLLDYKMKIAEYQYGAKLGKFKQGTPNKLASILSGVGGAITGVSNSSAAISDYIKSLKGTAPIDTSFNTGFNSGSKLSLY